MTKEAEKENLFQIGEEEKPYLKFTQGYLFGRIVADFVIRTKFEFFKDYVVFLIIEGSKFYRKKIPYENFGADIVESNKPGHIIWLLVGLFIIVFSVVFSVQNAEQSLDRAMAAMTFVLGAALLVLVYRLFLRNHKFFKISADDRFVNFIVLKDKNAERIINEVLHNRRLKLRKLHLKINPQDNYESFYARMMWLKDDKSITEDEFSEWIARGKEEISSLGAGSGGVGFVPSRVES